MIGYTALALIKILDNIILTAKNIATHKEQRAISTVLVMLSQLIFYLIIDKVTKDSTMTAILIVAISSGVGNYIAFLINDKLKKDAKWTMVIASSNIDDVKAFCNYLTVNKIKYTANKGYDRHWNDTIHIIAFSKTKEESKLIQKYIDETSTKYLVEII